MGLWSRSPSEKGHYLKRDTLNTHNRPSDNVVIDNSNTLIVRVLEIFAILRGILQQEYQFFDNDDQSGSKFPQSSKATNSKIPIREMILAQAAEYLAQQKSKIDMR